MNFYELLETIVEQPPPSAPADQFSPEFCSFISGWLVSNHCCKSFLFTFEVTFFVVEVDIICFNAFNEGYHWVITWLGSAI